MRWWRFPATDAVYETAEMWYAMIGELRKVARLDQAIHSGKDIMEKERERAFGARKCPSRECTPNDKISRIA